MAWALPDDVTAAWIGDNAPTDLSQIALWIGRAERKLRVALPGLKGRYFAVPVVEPDLKDNVRDVIVAMVTRVYRNPSGIRQVQETTGPFATSQTFSGANPGELTVTDDELDMLLPPGNVKGAFSIDLIPSTSPYSTLYRAAP